MARKDYTPEQAIGMLREAEVRLSQGEKIAFQIDRHELTGVCGCTSRHTGKYKAQCNSYEDGEPAILLDHGVN